MSSVARTVADSVTRTVSLTAYVNVPEGSSQKHAEAIVAAALSTDDRIFLVKAQRTIELVTT